jgi:hypothetical protein
MNFKEIYQYGARIEPTLINPNESPITMDENNLNVILIFKTI